MFKFVLGFQIIFGFFVFVFGDGLGVSCFWHGERRIENCIIALYFMFFDSYIVRGSIQIRV